MKQFRRMFVLTRKGLTDKNFVRTLGRLEALAARLLSTIMVVIIMVAIVDLALFVGRDLFSGPERFLDKTLFRIFGLFLDVLIALEILENITAYLKQHVIQVELVIATSLVAVARKIIIFDFSKSSGIELIGLASAVISLSTSYWIIRNLGLKREH